MKETYAVGKAFYLKTGLPNSFRKNAKVRITNYLDGKEEVEVSGKFNYRNRIARILISNLSATKLPPVAAQPLKPGTYNQLNRFGSYGTRIEGRRVIFGCGAVKIPIKDLSALADLLQKKNVSNLAKKFTDAQKLVNTSHINRTSSFFDVISLAEKLKKYQGTDAEKQDYAILGNVLKLTNGRYTIEKIAALDPNKIRRLYGPVVVS